MHWNLHVIDERVEDTVVIGYFGVGIDQHGHPRAFEFGAVIRHAGGCLGNVGKHLGLVPFLIQAPAVSEQKRVLFPLGMAEEFLVVLQ